MSFVESSMVQLIEKTQSPVWVLIQAYRKCRNSMKNSDSFFDVKGRFILGEKDRLLLENCIKRNHHAPLEFVSFTFEILGISKVADRQLVRHRIASYSGSSGRSIRTNDFLVPLNISQNKAAFSIYKEAVKSAEKYMEKLEALSIPLEDARYALPMGSTSSFLIKFNLRSIRNFLAERTCSKAQWEIREIAKQMRNIIAHIDPIMLFEYSKCSKCEEKCGG